MTNDTYSREAATARAIDCVTGSPLSLLSDDGATVVHVIGPNPKLAGANEDIYVCLGGAHDQDMIDHFFRGTTFRATLVSVHYREGQTCREAVDALSD